MLLDDFVHFESFTIDDIDRLAPRAELGKLGLNKVEIPKLKKSSIFTTRLFGRQDFDEPQSSQTQDDLKRTMKGNGIKGRQGTYVS